MSVLPIWCPCNFIELLFHAAVEVWDGCKMRNARAAAAWREKRLGWHRWEKEDERWEAWEGRQKENGGSLRWFMSQVRTALSVVFFWSLLRSVKQKRCCVCWSELSMSLRQLTRLHIIWPHIIIPQVAIRISFSSILFPIPTLSSAKS